LYLAKKKVYIMSNEIARQKKEVYPISENLRNYLKKYHRNVQLPISYSDLLRFQGGLPIYDEDGNDTLWLQTYFPESEREEINTGLKRIYSILHADGNDDILPFLNVDQIDFCSFGNTKPFRIKVRNVLNDNYTYLYVKKADASRAYGLELEDLLSPNQINFLVQGDTLIEEHILGIPGDVFIKDYLSKCTKEEQGAIAKDFVKFNERCFVRLLGDMRSYNYVVVLTHDFDRIQYRFRAIDFDQQSYEGEKGFYTPQFFKENYPLVKLVENNLPIDSVEQYKKEERALIAKRANSNYERLERLLKCMKKDVLSTEENISNLKNVLYQLTNDVSFKKSTNMGAIVKSALDFVVRNYENINPYIIK